MTLSNKESLAHHLKSVEETIAIINYPVISENSYPIFRL